MTITLGDIHCSPIWEDIVQKHSDARFIFIGDYCDAFEDWKYGPYNLERIIEFKINNPETILLLGNHDIQYMFTYEENGCSGFKRELYHTYYKLFNDHKELFQVAHQEDDTVWTHAGIHTGWYNQRFIPQWKKEMEEFELPERLADQLNMAFESRNRMTCLFDVGYLRGGVHDVGGIFWLDKRYSQAKPLKGYHQIVGHTHIDKMIKFDHGDDTSIRFVDCLPHDYYCDKPITYEDDSKID